MSIFKFFALLRTKAAHFFDPSKKSSVEEMKLLALIMQHTSKYPCSVTIFSLYQRNWKVTINCDHPDELIIPDEYGDSWKYLTGVVFLNSSQNLLIHVRAYKFYQFPMDEPEPAED